MAGLTCLVIVPCNDLFVVVVRRVSGIDAVGSVDQLQLVKLPIPSLFDVEDAAVCVG